MSDEIKIKTNSKKTKLIIAVVTIVIAVLTIGAIVLVSSGGATAKKVREQLSLGEKYLSELQYEQAIAAYELAIKIDPKCTDAYLGLVDIYNELGDYDKAEKILEKARAAVNEEDLGRVDRKQEAVRKNKEEAEGAPEPTAAPLPTPEPTKTSTPEPTKSAGSEVKFTGKTVDIEVAEIVSFSVPTSRIMTLGMEQKPSSGLYWISRTVNCYY